jgi:anaerobic ribonucleoside-triphosphate reductase activating protein
VSETLALFGTADDSIVDGPGIRFALFTQGCSRDCPGCHNPGAQPYEGGVSTTVDELMEKIRANPLLAGITLTGGEPFDQAAPLVKLARRVHALDRPLTVWAYSGYLFEELEGQAAGLAARELLHECDVLVDGPYVAALRSLDLRWRGSANQRIIDVVASLQQGRPVEYDA